MWAPFRRVATSWQIRAPARLGRRVNPTLHRSLLPRLASSIPHDRSTPEFKRKKADGIPTTTAARALAVNLDDDFYGSFAEIGAGQEVSRTFLRVGGAKGTVARSVSAYDMQMSDKMYGAASRYVTKERMLQMCHQEYHELEEACRKMKGDDTRFFSFASTVAAKAYMSNRECEAYMGCYYQKEKGQEPSLIWLHVRMNDPDAQLQADALGTLGCNLVYLCKQKHMPALTLIRHLLDDIEPGRLNINWVSFQGPGWKSVDDRLVALWLVQYGIAEAVVFQPKNEGHVATVPNLLFYKRPICAQRGRFLFVTKTNEAIFDAALAKLKEATQDAPRPPMPIMELTLTPLGNSPEALSTDIPFDVRRDFLSRFDVLAAMGFPIMVSGLRPMHEISAYMQRYTNQKIIIAVGGGAYSIEYGMFHGLVDCPGGRLEAFGRLFAQGVQVYVFPNILHDGTLRCDLISKIEDPGRRALLEYFRVSEKIVPIEEKYITPCVLNAETNTPWRGKVQDVLYKISQFDHTWKELIPAKLVDMVMKRGVSEIVRAQEHGVDIGGTGRGDELTNVLPLEKFSNDFWRSKGTQ
mmetsp:Transcript_70931/g.122954  ORF Transcript_70931/g.122954 Transcript_70931/m.122954 type:complete len:579 (-) Transcript_70931:199-1935(-)